MRRLMLAGLIGLLLTGPAGAARLVGDDTMADYRKWNETQRVAYLNGFTGLARIVGLQCPDPMTVGELMAALDYRTFDGGTKLANAIFQILAGRGCDVKGMAPKPGA